VDCRSIGLSGSHKSRFSGEPQAAQGGFVEPIALQPSRIEEFAIEFEAARRAKVRIQWKAAARPDWTNVPRACRETET
jgi:hypothetical protein